MKPDNLFNAHPHPDPLPRGEGTAAARLKNFASQLGKSSHMILPAVAMDSPSPRGEGRGEGGLKSNIQFQFS
jgi:hypothetical protein